MLTARISTPLFVERAKTQTLFIDIYSSGVLTAPTSGTVSIFDGFGSTIVDEAAVVVASSHATYSLLSTTIPVGTILSDKWLIEWTLLISSVTYTFRQEVFLVKRILYPVITDADLNVRHSELPNMFPSGLTTWQTYLDDSFDEIQNKLINEGKRPNLIISSSSLKESHLSLCLSRIFRDLSTYGNAGGKYDKLATYYGDKFEKDFSKIRLTYDYDEDGLPSGNESGVAMQPIIFLNKGAF